MYDDKDILIYEIVAAGCQGGLIFGCLGIGKSCQTVNFLIYDRSKNSDTKAECGTITRKGGPGTLSDYESYCLKLDLPTLADWKGKALLTSASIFIDYILFDDLCKPSR